MTFSLVELLVFKIRQKVLVVAKIIHGVSSSCSNMTRCTKLIRIWSYLYLQSHPPFYFAGRQQQRKRSSGKKGIIFWLVTIFGTSSKGWLKRSHVLVSNFSVSHMGKNWKKVFWCWMYRDYFCNFATADETTHIQNNFVYKKVIIIFFNCRCHVKRIIVLLLIDSRISLCMSFHSFPLFFVLRQVFYASQTRENNWNNEANKHVDDCKNIFANYSFWLTTQQLSVNLSRERKYVYRKTPYFF